MLTNPLSFFTPQNVQGESARALSGDHHHLRAGDAGRASGRATSSLPAITELTSNLRTNATAFADAAKEMVRGALKEFAKDLRAMFKDMGLDQAIAGQVVKSLIQPVAEALRSGADFSAQIFVAAASHTSIVTPNGSAQAFDLVAKGIDITVNHTTGEVAVETETLSVQTRQVSGTFADGPRIIDLTDGDANPMAGLFERFNELIAAQLDAIEDFVTEADPVADDTVAPAAPQAETAPAGPPGLRIAIEVLEHVSNRLGQRITHVRLDAVIPLTATAAESATAEPPPDGPVELVLRGSSA